jgi:hypothetical protein
MNMRNEWRNWRKRLRKRRKRRYMYQVYGADGAVRTARAVPTVRTVRTIRAPYVPMRGENGGRTCQFYWEMKPVGPMHIHTVEGMKGMDRHHFLREWNGEATTLSPRRGCRRPYVVRSSAGPRVL